MERDWWEVPYDHPDIVIQLESKTYITQDGFGQAPSIYPVTIVQARYNGTYEGSGWLCFPLSNQNLHLPPWEGWDDSDIECVEFWARAQKESWPIGHGSSPSESYLDLLHQVCHKAGVTFDDLVQEPSWPRQEKP